MFANIELPPLAPIGVGRTPPLYISLIFEGWIVHNYLIETRAANIVMLKAITEEMNLYYTRCIEGVFQLDLTPIDVMGCVKHVNMDFNKFTQIYVP